MVHILSYYKFVKCISHHPYPTFRLNKRRVCSVQGSNIILQLYLSNIHTISLLQSSALFRELPEDEISAISDTLKDLLLCRQDKLPLQLITHYFMYLYWKDQPMLHPHRKCLDGVTAKHGNAKECYNIINNKICLDRFNPEKPRSEFCKDVLWRQDASDQFLLMDGIKDTISMWKNKTDLARPMRPLLADKALPAKIYSYHKCMKQKLAEVSECIPNFKGICDNSQIRATKTVRVTMETVGELLKDIPHLKVIHLIRDPRPVTLSRSKAYTFQGKNSGSNLTSEASLYCSRVLRDVQLRKHMEKSHPTTFTQVIYEDFVNNPFDEAQRLYNFLDEAMPMDTIEWLEEASNRSQSISEAWKQKIIYGEYERIGEVCSGLLKVL